MPGRKVRLTSGSSLIIVGTSLTNPTSKTMKGINSIIFIPILSMHVKKILRLFSFLPKQIPNPRVHALSVFKILTSAVITVRCS